MVMVTGLDSLASLAVAGNNFMSLLLRKRRTTGSSPDFFEKLIADNQTAIRY